MVDVVMRIDADVETGMFDEFVQNSVKNLRSRRSKQRVIRSIVFLFIQSVVPKTPVDTGRARSGWSAAAEKIKAVGNIAQQIELSGGDHAMQEVGRGESSYTESFGVDDASAVLVNGVPYIVYLELGSSDQAPGGFVRIALREIASEAGNAVSDFTYEQLKDANTKARSKIGLRQGRVSSRAGLPDLRSR